MEHILLTPLVAFIVSLGLVALSLVTFGAFSLKSKTKYPGQGKAYACGEDVKCHRIRPEYSQFFSFAFFFTIMHVVALVVATCPAVARTIDGEFDLFPLGFALLYIIGAVTALFILYRR